MCTHIQKQKCAHNFIFSLFVAHALLLDSDAAEYSQSEEGRLAVHGGEERGGGAVKQLEEKKDRGMVK